MPIDRYDEVRRSLRRALGAGPRVDEYYLPFVAFVDRSIDHAARAPLFVGVSGPQGSGKSTLAAHAVRELTRLGRSAAALSIDDFYLTHAEQLALAAAHPGNRYLEHRGYPGTHDVALGARTLDALAARTRGELRVVTYDKGAFGGRGDRSDPSAFARVETPLDVVLLEGWMLGFEPVDADEIDDPDLRTVNTALARYRAWTSRFGAFVHLDTHDLDAIVRWRVEAERERRAATSAGLSDDDARDYIERFLPAYRLFVPRLRARRPIDGPVLRVELGPDRSPLRAPEET